MVGIYWTGFAGRTNPALGWATNTVRFSLRRVAATVALSSVVGQNGDRFEPFANRAVRCWLETERTPTTVLGGVVIATPDLFADVQVQLETTWVRFQLQTNGSAGGALETVYDLSGAADAFPAVVNRSDRVVHDADGVVVGIHREEQLEGADDLDDAVVDAAVDARIAADELSGLTVLRTDLSAFPASADLRVDVASRAVRVV